MSIRRLLMTVMVFVAMVTLATAAPTSQPTETAAAARFTFVDVIIDAKDRPLAAYQFDFKATGGGVRIVGIEGGEHTAFAKPPYYDPAAMQGDHVIAAAYSTASALPIGVTRIARLHLHVTSARPTYAVQLITAGSTDGKPMSAMISIREGTAP